MNGPGEVLHAFDAEAGEELSVYAGEEVRLLSQHWEDAIQSFTCRCKRDKAAYWSCSYLQKAEPGAGSCQVQAGDCVETG